MSDSSSSAGASITIELMLRGGECLASQVISRDAIPPHSMHEC
jgi:hypothetical protein